jgi:hypothetical protein
MFKISQTVQDNKIVFKLIFWIKIMLNSIKWTGQIVKILT